MQSEISQIAVSEGLIDLISINRIFSLIVTREVGTTYRIPVTKSLRMKRFESLQASDLHLCNLFAIIPEKIAIIAKIPLQRFRPLTCTYVR